MLFSIIVPVYNVGNYLPRCMESIVNQNHVEFEVILVDDGSTDESGGMCDRYSERYSNVFVIHKENGGLSDARNTGIRNAKGDYILFVDGDDYINAGSLQSIADTIRAEDFPDVVCLELIKFFENSTKTVPMGDGIDENINRLNGDEVYRYLAGLPKYPASACTKAIRRQLFLENDLFFKNDLLSEDLEWCIRLFLYAESFGCCPYPYYFYRQGRKDSISNTASEKKTMDILGTFQKWTARGGDRNESERKMIYSYMEYIFRFLLLGYETVSGEKREAYRKALREGSWILGARKDKVSRCIRISYRIFGIKATGMLLKKFLSAREYLRNFA